VKALLVFLLSTVAMAATPIQPKTVFYGDSITYNWAVPIPLGVAGGWPGVENAFQVNKNWINEGQNAAVTSTELLARFNTDVVSFHPVVVHILMGYYDLANVCTASNEYCASNPSLIASTLLTLQNNTKAMVALASKNGIKVVLGCIPPMSPTLAPVNSAMALDVYNFNNNWLKPYGISSSIPVVDYNAILGFYQSPGFDTYISGYSFDSINPNYIGFGQMTPWALIAVDIADLALKSGYLAPESSQDAAINAAENVIDMSKFDATTALGFIPQGLFSDGVVRPLNSLYITYGKETWSLSNPKIMILNPVYGAVGPTGVLGVERVSVKVHGVPFSPWQITVIQ
jgi:hypothetical protein